jgi:hypothetical protein
MLECKRFHNELPDFLIPYKRYDRESIESVITNQSDLHVCADESTLYRWRRWFKEMADHIRGCLVSIMIQYGKESAEDKSGLPKSKLQRIWQYVGDAPVVAKLSNLSKFKFMAAYRSHFVQRDTAIPHAETLKRRSA